MVQFKIPFVDLTVDTTDPSGSAMNFGGAVAGIIALFGATGVATYVYNRAKSVAGVEGEQQIPGV
ncbi:hypothetical protein SAMN04488063_0098 [Halopelagius inordinatus]|uniref:Uncharacterized protein n=1 Tax=Halopelagius inordinatus TaxID=553467 RepID=A0A1I2X1U7_9EURY|nr:hypothetical protein [Halopelagius inordinatus]SFH07495.1 hypothetical protein SAMN04488063_0098 [Halopelagius inordinatus]